MADSCIVRRWWSKVDRDTPHGCWLWTGTTGARGYGELRGLDNRKVYAHHLAYDLFVGDRPPRSESGLTLNHLCTNPPCVNPDHLELVAHIDNVNADADDMTGFEVDCRLPYCRRCSVLHRSDVQPNDRPVGRRMGRRQCSVPECGGTHKARGLCAWHYHRWYMQQNDPQWAPVEDGQRVPLEAVLASAGAAGIADLAKRLSGEVRGEPGYESYRKRLARSRDAGGLLPSFLHECSDRLGIELEVSA